MGSDRARVSYDPARHWRSLVAQQGRVTVESDWNEEVAILDERDRLETLDVVGPFGSPDGGYAVTVVPAGGAGGSTAGDLIVGPGILYLGGERLELDAAITYSTQPDWLDHSSDPLWLDPSIPDGTADELVYLLAIDQEVSAVEDPALADVALGGPDTMQRKRLLQHAVRQMSDGATCTTAWDDFQQSLGAEGLSFDPSTMLLESTTTLQASFTELPGPVSLCQPVATGGYLGAENQMLRVMVTSVTNGVPEIVWGFDDASFLYRLAAATYDTAADATTFTLGRAPVDSYHFPQLGQVVELLRDAVQLTPTDYIASATGFVSTATATYDPTSMDLVVSGQPPTDYLSPATPQLYLRIWQETATATPGQAVALGDTGMAVTLTSSSGTFHPGDFWRFALRPIDPTIVYPARYLEAPQPPDGPRTWACPLAVLAWDAGTATVSPCVPPFTSLVNQSSGGGCCTVVVSPDDVAGGASLQALLQRFSGQGPVSICLEPGTYRLPRPLVIDSGLPWLNLSGCSGQVILEAAEATSGAFVDGLIALRGAAEVTLSGLIFSLPEARFVPNGDAFNGLAPANRELLLSYSRDLAVAVGISAVTTDGVVIENCTFSFPVGGDNLFAAGILATGAMEALEVRGCTFVNEVPPATAPFYDLALGNQAEPPFRLMLGYLQVPIFMPTPTPPPPVPPPSPSPSAFGVVNDEDAATPARTGFFERALRTVGIHDQAAPEGSSGTAPSVAAAPSDQVTAEAAPVTDERLTVQALHPAVFERNRFNAVTVAVLAMAELGTLRVDSNVVADAYGGFWFVSLAEQASLAMFEKLAVGSQTIFAAMSQEGLAALVDRIFVIVIALGETLPLTTASGSALTTGAVPLADAALLDAARARFAYLYQQAASSGGTGSTAPNAAADLSGPEPTAPTTPATSVAPGTAQVPPEIQQAFTVAGVQPIDFVPPATDTGTQIHLRLDVADCEIDAVLLDSNSGAALLVLDFTATVGSGIVHGNRFRDRFTSGETALVACTEASVTGNIVANEVAATNDQVKEQVPSYSLVVASPVKTNTPVAITGNVCVSPIRVPARPGIAAPLDQWAVLNTVVPF